MKSDLMSPLSHEFARRECSIHSRMRHPNIIRLYDYAESEREYQLYMEYAERSDFLCEKILEVSNLTCNNAATYIICVKSLKILINLLIEAHPSEERRKTQILV
jgi:serine/threonine protein kinase